MRILTLAVALALASCDHPRGAATRGAASTRDMHGETVNAIDGMIVEVPGATHAEFTAISAEGQWALALIVASKSPLFDQCGIGGDMAVMVDGSSIVPRDVDYNASVAGGFVIERLMQEIGPTAVTALAHAAEIEVEVCGRRQFALAADQVETLRAWARMPMLGGRTARHE